MAEPPEPGGSAPAPDEQPLDRITSIKLKLGLLVAISVAAAATLATLGVRGAVEPWVAVPVAVALALGLTQLLATGMTAPLREMTHAVRAMATGDYSRRVRATSRDEVGQLADAFNTMAADLATVDRQRRELVATVSHELRTPLTAVSARLENLVDGVEEATPESLDEVLVQTRRLGALVSDLLDLSRVDAGIKPLALERVEVAGLVAAVVREAGPTARQVGYAVEVEPGLTARVDPARIHQLLANLLDNAARHGPAGGTVRVTARRVGGGWELRVGDDGPGIAVGEQERVFERFGTGTSSSGGTGLGLAIARWVVDLHGGRIGFDSAAAGTVVTVVLPDEAGDPPSRAPAQRAHSARTTAPTPVAAQQEAQQEAQQVSQQPAQQPAQPSGPGAPHPMPPVPIPALDLWPETDARPRPLLLGMCALVGASAAWLWPDSESMGLSLTLVLVAAGLVIWAVAARGRGWFTITSLLLAAGLALTPALRADEGLVALCLLAAVALVLVGVADAHRVSGVLLAGLAWPLAGLRGLPWLGRTFRAASGHHHSLAVVRTVLWCLAALVVFGLLFASADALFASWTDAVLPDLTLDSWIQRGFMTVAVGGVVLAAAYVAINPPPVDTLPTITRPVARRFEWLAPVLLVDAIFVLFLATQAAAVFGGRGYVERTTGLSYADYVHQGFGQFVVAAGLTLIVVWVAAHKAPTETVADRLWLKGAIGMLLVLTLVMLISALVRMDAYFDAFGLSRLRLLVTVFEVWLGLVVLAVILAGLWSGMVRVGGLTVARIAVLSGAALLLAFALANPDAWIARHNLDRFEETGRLDWIYLSELSADATEALLEVDDPELRTCLIQRLELDSPVEGWQSWNLARHRSDALLADIEIAEPDPTASYRALQSPDCTLDYGAFEGNPDESGEGRFLD